MMEAVPHNPGATVGYIEALQRCRGHSHGGGVAQCIAVPTGDAKDDADADAKGLMIGSE